MSGNTPKILVVAGIVVIALFVAGIGIGSSGGLPGLSVDRVLDAFEGLMPAAPVAMSDVTASPDGCLDRTLQRVVVPTLGSCELTIAAASAHVRRLTLTSASALRVRLAVTPASGRTLTITDSLPAEDAPVNQLQLDIFGEGGTLSIDSCAPAGGSACVVDLS